ncbi:glycoside hydrolase [Cladorrhinum samala]|uniref:Glycoside hydrolase n=1 Tax=Cladorrhinum samala TaxID=585594 RepID=A0AAV9HXG1_9PEZI|nr:glycoside hydrolase [Cladorrhinum samala]
MKFLLALASVALPTAHAAKEVFAHMIVGNVNNFDLADWENDMRLAKESSIDAFVLNVGAGDENNDRSLELAFQAANSQSFKLFFSFDYLGGPAGPWPKDQVIALLEKFGNDPAYFKHDGQRPFVSTFEGPDNAADWTDIKAGSNAFFIPDWSSKSPAEAVTLAGGVADGLFNFDPWPVGPSNVSTDLDKPFLDALGDKLYMMPVSPWFYTNLPKLNKNWLWPGDGLWDTRWNQVMELQPDFVQILTWNDFGESHYIGPVNEKQLGLFTTFEAPVNYVKDLAHDGWRKFLPFYIEQYKTGQAPAEFAEQAAAYYRTAAALACASGGTTGNNPAFGEPQFNPEDLMEDAVFFAALLKSDEGVTVSVSIGGQTQEASFSIAPPSGAGTAGVYRGSVPFGGNTGDVVVTVSRGGETVATAEGGKPISGTCENDVQNWNAVAV